MKKIIALLLLMFCTSLCVFSIEEKEEFKIFQQYKQDYHQVYSFDNPSLGYMNPMFWGMGRRGIRGGGIYGGSYMYNPYYLYEYNDINRQGLEQFTKNSPKDTYVDVNTYNIFHREDEK